MASVNTFSLNQTVTEVQQIVLLATSICRYIIVCTQPHKEWCLGKVSGIRGVLPEVLKDQCFSSRLEAEHGVFLARLKDCGLV